MIDTASVFDEATEEQRDELRQKLRGLIESAGYPYIKVTITDPENGGVNIEHQGFDEDFDLAAAFQELALVVADQA